MGDEAFPYLALSLIPGLGRHRMRRLIEVFGSAGAVLCASRAALQQCDLELTVVASIISGRARKEAELEFEKVQVAGARILCPDSPEYPALLREIVDIPLVLYCLGDMSALSAPCIAIVGSRNCSVYGRQVSQKFARQLALSGFTIVSGLARGIDSAAHQGALEGNGKTIAVLGNGLDRVYPRENRSLFLRIQADGCLVSEFPIGSYPAPQNFPVRNRLISGLSYGTLVSEAAEFSGSLITARLSLEQNREVWALPGNITSPGSYGPNYLIRQGARAVLSPQDILEDLPPHVISGLLKKPWEGSGATGERGSETPLFDGPCKDQNELDLPSRHKQVLQLLDVDRTLHIDRIVAETGLQPDRLASILLSLEVEGLVKQLPGRKFARTLS